VTLGALPSSFGAFASPGRELSAQGAETAVERAAASGVPAAGGQGLLQAAVDAPLVAVGVVGAPEPLDERSWRAQIELEAVLAGDAEPGSVRTLAWEELARERPRRFDEGTRILAALGPLPGWSIWRERLRDGGTEGEGQTLGVARRGRAFLRDPDPATLDLLAAFLALAPEDRTAAPGIRALAALAAGAHPALAEDALDALARAPALSELLGEPGRRDLARLLADPDRPGALRRGALDLVGERGLEALRPALRPLQEAGAPLAPEALAAEARLDGGLAAERVAGLIEREEPGVRAVAVRFAPVSLEPDPAAAALAADPATSVRAAAAEALGARRGMGAYDPLLDALRDPEEEVRAAAARALGALGAPAVPRLAQVALEQEDPVVARGAILALARAAAHGEGGAEATKALRALAASHPDPKLRGLAGFLSGVPQGRH